MLCWYPLLDPDWDEDDTLDRLKREVALTGCLQFLPIIPSNYDNFGGLHQFSTWRSAHPRQRPMYYEPEWKRLKKHRLELLAQYRRRHADA